MSETATLPEKFQIGRVFGRTFAVAGRHLGLFLGLALLLYGLPILVGDLLTGASAVPGPSGQTQASGMEAAVGALVTFVILLVSGPLLQASLVRATIEDLHGRKPRFGQCLGAAFSLILPILAISFLVWLGTFVGLILLIVPGVILWLGWVAAVPVRVQEGLGVLASMKRSRALAKGSKWRIFWLFLILILALAVLQGLLGLLAYLTAAVAPGLLVSIVSALLQSVVTGVIVIASAATYVELRAIKEGGSAQELAEIFA